MTVTFDHTTPRQRVLFGGGNAAVNLATEARRLRSARVMALAAESDRQPAERACADIDVARWFDRIAQHVPVETERLAAPLDAALLGTDPASVPPRGPRPGANP